MDLPNPNELRRGWRGGGALRGGVFFWLMEDGDLRGGGGVLDTDA